MDWFDGDALDTYEKDFDRWEYNKREFKLLPTIVTLQYRET